VENVYIILKQIYLGNGVPNFIRIARGIEDITKKHFGLFFAEHNLTRLLCTALFVLLDVFETHFWVRPWAKLCYSAGLGNVENTSRKYTG